MPHTAAKHDLLRTYLGAWFAIFGQHPSFTKVNVIDGFAGPGVYQEGEPGSPIVMLRTLLDHSAFDSFDGTQFNFLFNEQDPDRFASLSERVEALRAECGGFPANVAIGLENRNFHELGEELLGGIASNEVLNPTFFFIDPFGYKDVPLSLVQRLLNFNACEMLLYFDFNSVNRFATAGNVDDHFEALFGTPEFKAAPRGGQDRHEYLRNLYEKQLREACGFSYVRSFAMVPKTGHVSHYLFFCTRNLQAFDKMKAQMWKLDPRGSYRFEDRLAGQDVLFGAQGSVGPLKTALIAEFKDKVVSIEEIVLWVKRETPYYEGQVKLATLRPMQMEDGSVEGVNQKRRGQFPAGTTVRFLSR